MRKMDKKNGRGETAARASREKKSRSFRRRSTAFLASALGLATLGAFATFADESREWVDSDGKTVCRGTFDVERTLDDAPGDGAPNKVYFRTDDGEEITYRYRWLSEGDRKRVLAALDAPPKSKKSSKPTPRTPASDKNSDGSWDGRHKAGTRKVLTINGVEYAFRYCPAGTFTMGSPVEECARHTYTWGMERLTGESGSVRYFYDETQHKVTLTRGFWMLETEVTVEMWRSFVAATNYKMGSDGGAGYNAATGVFDYDSTYTWENPGFKQTPTHPVTQIDYDGAVAFCAWLSRKANLPLRLPTEAEWEYACRAGATGRYNVDGASLNELGWYSNNSGNKTCAVGQKTANAWGLYDMHGNVNEWCADWYDAQQYDTASQTDPTGATSGSVRVFRGGSCFNDADDCRSAKRSCQQPWLRDSGCGFRLVLGRKR